MSTWVVGSGMRLKLGSNKKLGAWSLADGHKSPIGWPVGIRHSRDVATRFRLSRLDRRSLCGPPDPRRGPAASEISQLRYSGGLGILTPASWQPPILSVSRDSRAISQRHPKKPPLRPTEVILIKSTLLLT